MLSWTAFYGLHCVSRCQENITYGGSKWQKKIGSPAIRGSWDDAPHRRWVKPPAPPWKKARSAPEALRIKNKDNVNKRDYSLRNI